jgi:hypothetical protein
MKAGEKNDAGGEKSEEKKGENGCRIDGIIKITRLCIEEAVYGQEYLYCWLG